MAATSTSRPRRTAVQSSPYATSSTPSAAPSTAPNKSSPSKQSAQPPAAEGVKPGYTANGKKIGRPLKKGRKAAEARRKSAAGKAAAKARREGGVVKQEEEEGEDGEDEDDEAEGEDAEEGDAKMDEGEQEGDGKGEVDRVGKDGEADGEAKEKEKEDDPCPACKGAKDDAVWVECDSCNKWYHWSCVSPDLTSTPENIDKWYCPPCITLSSSTPTPLTTTYKPSPSTSQPSTSSAFPLPAHLPPAPVSTPPLRKSQRTTRTRNIDYANLDQHLPARVDKWTKVIAARTAEGKVVGGFAPLPSGGGFRRMRGEEVGDPKWLYGSGDGGEGEGFREPFVVENPEGLGMKMPDGRITVRDVARLVGEKTPLEVIDCASQSSLNNWNLGQWADYYEDVGGPNGTGREKVRNVISLEVSETELGGMVEAPEVVRSLDWVNQCWPADMKVPGSGEYPRVQKYCLMSVERCWTDWHVDFAGSSVFYHILRGSKTFYFIRPTAANLSAYERWSGSTERQESTWLGDSVDVVYKVELKKGETAFIPTGWIHAVYTPSDSLVIGGNFLHSLNIPTQLRIYQIELATKVPRKFRFPHFVRLLWFVAKTYHHRLSSHPPNTPLPPDLSSPRVLEGLKQLSSFLIEQTTRFAKGANVSAERRRLARENIPHSKIPDPVGLSREFRKVVLKAKGEELDQECFLPHVAAPVGEEAAANGTGTGSSNGAGGAGGGAGTKRKAESPAVQGEGAMLPPASTRAKIKHGSASTPAVAPLVAPYAHPHASGSRPGSSSGLTNPSAAAGFSTPSPSSAGFPPGQVPAAGGEANIIGRQQVPVIQQTRMEERIDPSYPQYGARVAEVKESRSTQSVVRRWENDPLPPAQGGAAGAGGGGGPVVETRTVITIIERVRWTGQPGGSLRSPYPPYHQYSSMNNAQQQGAAYQPQGVGPAVPAVPPMGQGASTVSPVVAQQRAVAAAQQGGGMNPAPYPAYGYPYHYNLPASSSSSSASPSSGPSNAAASSPSTAQQAPSILQHPQYAQQQQQQQQQQQLAAYPPPAAYPSHQQPSPYAQQQQAAPQPNPYAAAAPPPLPALPPPPPSGFASSASGGAMALALGQVQQGQAQPPFTAMAGAAQGYGA